MFIFYSPIIIIIIIIPAGLFFPHETRPIPIIIPIPSADTDRVTHTTRKYQDGVCRGGALQGRGAGGPLVGQ